MTSLATPQTQAVRITGRLPIALAVTSTIVRFLLGLGLLVVCLSLAFLLGGAPSPHTFLLATAAGIYALMCFADVTRMAATIGATK